MSPLSPAPVVLLKAQAAVLAVSGCWVRVYLRRGTEDHRQREVCHFRVTRMWWTVLTHGSYLRLLEEKVKAYEGAPDTVTRSRAVAGPSRRTTSDEYANDEEFEDEHPLLEPFNQLTVDRVSTSKCSLPFTPECRRPQSKFPQDRWFCTSLTLALDSTTGRTCIRDLSCA